MHKQDDAYVCILFHAEDVRLQGGQDTQDALRVGLNPLKKKATSS